MLIRNKLFAVSLMLGCFALPGVCSETLQDLSLPKPPAYRVGISEIPENQYVQAVQEMNKPEKKYAQIDDTQEAGIADLTYADLSIKRLSKEVAQELEFEQQDMLADLSLLWHGAAVQSDTINFTLYKLANPDADKPDEKSIKKVLSTIASMSTLVGASMGSPILAGSSLIGGNILGIMSQDTKALNYKYTRVNDADMIILIRKVEDLQQRAVNLYYDYMTAKKQLELTTDLVEDRQRKFELAQKNNAPRELVVITDAYYRTALDKQRSAKSDFYSKRAALEQFVGNETFLQFEAELLARENGDTTDKKNSDNVQVVETAQPDNTAPQQKAEITAEVQPQEPSTQPQNVQPIVNSAASAESSAQVTVPDLKIDNEANLVNKQKNQPIEDVENETDTITGSSSNIDDIEGKKLSFFSKFKKDKSEEASAGESAENANQEEVKPKKEDKYSTKGLIFIHDNDKPKPKRWWETPKSLDNYDNDGLRVNEPSFVNNTPSTSHRRFQKDDNVNNNSGYSEQNYSDDTKKVNSKRNYSNTSGRTNEAGSEGYNFEPLETIKVPDLRPGGYSIHSVPYEEINDGTVPAPTFQY